MTLNISLVCQTIEYIEQNLDKKLTLNILSEMLHYSPYYLHHVFSKVVGMTLYTYIQRRQLSEAAKTLVYKNIPISDIAQNAGYATQQSFTNAFSAMYKLSPKQFRNQEIYYPLQLPFTFNNSIPYPDISNLQIKVASTNDILYWMELLKLTVDGFPYLDTNAYQKYLHVLIKQQNCFVLYHQNLLISSMILNYQTNSIEFWNIHPLYRKTDILKYLFNIAKQELSTPICTTTYRYNDPADTGFRKLLLQLGFKEQELLIEFGYPTQRLLLEGEAHGYTK